MQEICVIIFFSPNWQKLNQYLEFKYSEYVARKKKKKKKKNSISRIHQSNIDISIDIEWPGVPSHGRIYILAVLGTMFSFIFSGISLIKVNHLKSRVDQLAQSQQEMIHVMEESLSHKYDKMGGETESSS